MATILAVPAVQTTQATTNPRKRKKRAPAAGAATDCFTCAERNVKCDRRRPYCSQCLDGGHDCSGYKTQLTWGVGVASRGKLRGLSLPIAGTQKVASVDKPPKAKRQKENTDNGLGNAQGVKEAQQDGAGLSRSGGHSPIPTIEGSSTTTEQASGMRTDPRLGLDLSLDTSCAAPQLFLSDEDTSLELYARPNRLPVTDIEENVWQHPPIPTPSYIHPNHVVTTSATSDHNLLTSTYMFDPGSYARSPALISPGPLTVASFSEAVADHEAERPYDGISMLLQAGQSMPMQLSNYPEEADEEVRKQPYDESALTDELSLFPASPYEFSFPMPALSGMSNIGKTARIQYLVNYYAEVISPVIVAFDSPNNPFRTQILRMAMNSETLQHAISALSASNLRQRRGIGLLSTGKTAPARRSSFAHVTLTDEKWHAQALLSAEEQIREETFHKRLAISQLNQQLAHPVLRKDDSILATLLILCLFHICDSGIAKFQTQFAGVRKLLALRGDDQGIGSESSRWMSRLFTWFDSLAATVNDRESQLSGYFLDMSVLCGDWCLENLAGIDGQLVRTISRLGRLNMLRQGKAVAFDAAFVSGPLPPPSFTAGAYATLDGNGWMLRNAANHGSSADSPLDEHKQFWDEWQDIRHDLLSWTLDTSLFDSISKEASYLTMEQRVDMENISQCFRYAALIYTERLAQPQLASNDEAIQRWVRRSLDHIRRVQSDVYLLWPLFITGTECVDEEGRSVIRGRCTDIQKDSGFVNNASCLELLEKVWRANSPGTSPRSDVGSPTSNQGQRGPRSSSFMFREVMIREAANGADGEYIVV